MAATRDCVVLVHGLGSNRLMMWLLEKRLAAYGYEVVNWGYRSMSCTVEGHGRDLADQLAELDADRDVRSLSLVTHSMGGIVARSALTHGRPTKLKRMVMLCPPNRGSRWATWLGPIFRPVCQTLDQLAARPDSFVNCLPLPEGLEVGIIAAEYDALVHLDSTRLGVERDHLVWPLTLHSGILFRAGVVEQIACFLRTGAFLRTPSPMAASA